MDLGNAIQAHSEWKVKFRTAIAKQETMDTATISADHCCALGAWLHGEGKKRFGSLASHTKCVANHRLFHVEAGKIAQAINAKRYPEAERMLAINTPFAAASTAVGAAILLLKREAAV